MYEVYVATQFEAAHRLVGDFGLATRTHGHTYRMDVIVRGERLSGDGTLYDIGELRPAVETPPPPPPLPRPERSAGPRGCQHDGGSGGQLLLGEARTAAARPEPRLPHGTHLGIRTGLRRPRR